VICSFAKSLASFSAFSLCFSRWCSEGGSDSGVPSTDGAGLGRFIAEIAGFLDPAEYPRDRRITVAGRVTGTLTRSVGDYPYSYPVVAVTQYRIWAPPLPAPYWHRYPYYYGPPFYPWGWGYPWRPWYPGWPYYW